MAHQHLEQAHALRKAVDRKTVRRVLPFILAAYFLCYLDRVNISYASLEMNADIGLSEAAYGIGAGIFFVAYFIFEVPSNVLLTKFGPRIWIARIMITWGIIAGCMSLAQGPISFYVLRFLLGVAEAGFFPAMILYLTYWFPARRRAQITAMFFMAVPLSGLVGGPLSTWLMTEAHGLFGLRGWQSMFIIEAVPTVLLGIAALWILVDRPEKAKFLREDERSWLVAELRLENQAVSASGHSPKGVFRTMLTPVVLAMSLIYLGLEFGEYAIGFFMPQMVAALDEQFGGDLGLVQIGFITAIPSLVAVLVMIWWGRHSDRTQERTWHIIGPAVLGAIAIAAAPYVTSFWATIALYSVTAACVFSVIPVFWQLPSRYLTGVSAAVGIALINSVGNLSGIIAPSLTGVLKQATGSFGPGYLLIALFLVIAAVGTLILRKAVPPTASVPSTEAISTVLSEGQRVR
ncbi:MFS transporter [Leucobacter ruminantium]|uniref:MFS transporter n=1 Tax=Leucobacter ruminantium TaxID=1289170 RepID=A0A939LTD9_9MICO|nr:MFS transporter [Leucobacter ruminantium]MBO1804394.1 MFS transporter [Leucobacter ruminantium]